MISKDLEIVIASSKNTSTGEVMRHPVFGIWRVDLRQNLKKDLQNGTRKIILWAEKFKFGIVMFHFDHLHNDPFFNVNTPSDLIKASERLSGDNQ